MFFVSRDFFLIYAYHVAAVPVPKSEWVATSRFEYIKFEGETTYITDPSTHVFLRDTQYLYHYLIAAGNTTWVDNRTRARYAIDGEIVDDWIGTYHGPQHSLLGEWLQVLQYVQFQAYFVFV